MQKTISRKGNKEKETKNGIYPKIINFFLNFCLLLNKIIFLIINDTIQDRKAFGTKYIIVST